MRPAPRCAVLLAAGLSAAELSGASPAVPRGALPGQIESRFAAPPEPGAGAQLALPATPSGEALPSGGAGVRLLLNGVVFDGATVYAADELERYARGLVGREVSLAEIYGVADAVTARYRNDGYILSRAIVPPQRIRDGVVRIQVVEGFLDEVRLEGAAAGASSLPAAYAEHMRAARPLNAEALERYLLLMNDLPGTVAKGILAPSERTPGAATLTALLERQPVEFVAGVNNRGSRQLGPWQADLDLDLNSALGGDERFNLRAARTLGNDELGYLALAYSQPLGTEGTTLEMSASTARSNPGRAAGGDPIGLAGNLQTDSRTWSLGLQHPLLRSRAQNLRLRAAFGANDGEQDYGDLPGFASTEDRVRALRLGATYDLLDRWRGVSLLDVELSQGLDVLDASAADDPEVSRPGASPTFTKVALYASRLQSLAPQWSLLVAAQGQYAANALLVAEQFGVGGERFGRAYDASEILGDSGIAGKLELRYAGDGNGWLPAYTAYAYYDVGQVWIRNPGVDLAGGTLPARQSLAAAGAGLRFDIERGFAGYLEFGKPLTRDVAGEGDKDPRLFVGASYRY